VCLIEHIIFIFLKYKVTQGYSMLLELSSKLVLQNDTSIIICSLDSLAWSCKIFSNSYSCMSRNVFVDVRPYSYVGSSGEDDESGLGDSESVLSCDLPVLSINLGNDISTQTSQVVLLLLPLQTHVHVTVYVNACHNTCQYISQHMSVHVTVCH